MSDENKMVQYNEETKKLEELLNQKQGLWDATVSEYSEKVRGDITQLHVVDSEITNSRQMVVSEIRKYALLVHKTNKAMKPMVKKQFEHYSTSYQIALKSSSDKMKLIESDLRIVQYKIDLLDSHISYLRDTNDNLKQLGYSVKNRIELLKQMGID